MKKFALIIWVIFLISCNSKKQDDIIYVSALRGPTAIALAGWIDRPPLIAGKTVVVKIVDSPEQIQAMLIKGETDIAALPMISAVNLYNKGVTRYTLAGCPVWGNLYWIGHTNAGQLHVFGAGTTPDILTRYYMDLEGRNFTLDYSLTTASEITRGFLSGKVKAAVLAEPFVDAVMKRDSSLLQLADLNNPDAHTPGFAETAIVINKELIPQRSTIDSLLHVSCQLATDRPQSVIQIMETHDVFPFGLLSIASLKRSNIFYKTALDAEKEIKAFLHIIQKYEPKAIGGDLPDDSFFNSSAK